MHGIAYPSYSGLITMLVVQPKVISFKNCNSDQFFMGSACFFTPTEQFDNSSTTINQNYDDQFMYILFLLVNKNTEGILVQPSHNLNWVPQVLDRKEIHADLIVSHKG